jgi:acetyltransferase-like isoleucine patch superfamily enzyme
MVIRFIKRLLKTILRRQSNQVGTLGGGDKALIKKVTKKTNRENPLEELRGLKEKLRKNNKNNYPQKNIEIGDYTYGFPKVKGWTDQVKLKIGKFCSIAEGVLILLGGDHAAEWISAYPFYGFLHAFKDKRKDYVKNGNKVLMGNDVIIGNDVWIATNATIMSGVVIGDGCIIGANALITKDKRLPDYSIWAGVPATQMGMRFPDEMVSQLKSIKWWDWPDEDICNAIPLLLNNDVASLTAYYRANIAPKKQEAHF